MFCCKGTDIMTNEYVVARIQAIQQELEELKKAIAFSGDSPKKTKLKGLWKGLNINEEDIEEAKQALFKDAYRFKG
jgi:ribosome-binding ATPase YchF (GTP1/OBG family)